MHKVLISIAGATGIGKTSLAIELAQALGTEILSADSRQFYTEMRIGTAVPSKTELELVPHHFIQHKSILEAYSVGAFRDDVLALMHNLFQKHDTLIMVGGSGLYLDAVTKGLDNFPEVKPGIRNTLIDIYENRGIQELQLMLQQHDPQYFASVDLQNPHRLIRALEVCISSEKPYSSFTGKREVPDFFRELPIGITAPRPEIYTRIEHRVDQMMLEGLLEEVKSLLPFRHLNALQTVGYQELFRYLDSDFSLEEAVSEIKKNTRRFAKRQETWFKRNKNIIWFSRDTPFPEVLKTVQEQLNIQQSEH